MRSSPRAKALKYGRPRGESLQVFLSKPEVPIDSNHLERRLRAISTGRRNWLSAWAEIGAERISHHEGQPQTVLSGNAGRRVMDWVDYSDRHPWPVAPDGSGASLAKL